MMHSSEVLHQRAIESGWQRLEGITTWPGSPKYPYTGWQISKGHAAPDRPDSLKGFQGHDDRCVECNAWINYDWLNKATLKAHLHCFHCNLYREKIEKLKRMPDRIAIIDGVYYGIGERKAPSDFNGYAGRWFEIQFNDGRIVKTCDLWCGGDIPERFQDRLPNNAVFVLPKPREQATVTSWT